MSIDRNAVLEEAAKVAEAEPTLYFNDQLGRDNAAMRKAHGIAIAAAIRQMKTQSVEPGTIRVCPVRDARCPHGIDCPYAIDRGSCNMEASRTALRTAP